MLQASKSHATPPTRKEECHHSLTDLVRHIVAAYDPSVTSAFNVLGRSLGCSRRGLKGMPRYEAKCNPNIALLGTQSPGRSWLRLRLLWPRRDGRRPCSRSASPPTPSSTASPSCTSSTPQVSTSMPPPPSVPWRRWVRSIKHFHPRCKLLLRLKVPAAGDALAMVSSCHAATRAELKFA